MHPTINIYRSRINHVIDHVNSNLHQSFTLEELASVAHFSPFHFHRIFVAITGESVNYFTNRVRLEKAARLLKFSNVNAGDIAYHCGFSSTSTLSRSFKKHFGISPSSYRKAGEFDISKIGKELFPLEQYLVPMKLEVKRKVFPIEVMKLPRRKVAYIRVLDSYREGVVINAFKELISWSKKEGLYKTQEFFGMSLDDPLTTPQNKFRYEVCMTIPKEKEVSESSRIKIMTMPELKYAYTVISGDIKIVATATHYMFNQWLINSNYEPEHQHGLEIFLDKENICNWENFNLKLCIPVKKLNR